MRVAISTTDRDPSYVGTTLETLFAAVEPGVVHVRCVISGDDATYLDHWRDRIDHIELLDAHESKMLEGRCTKQRVFYNTLRCLTDNLNPFLYCQDDVRFTSDWFSKLVGICTQRVPRYLKVLHYPISRYILSLYAAYPFKTVPVCQYPTQKFYGNQALLFSADALQEVGEAMRKAWVDNCMMPDDMWLKRYCMQTDLPILCCVPNLVQHIGRSSTSKNSSHTSPTFKE